LEISKGQIVVLEIQEEEPQQEIKTFDRMQRNFAANQSPQRRTELPVVTGTVTGQITAANVIAASTTSQMIVAGELAEVVAAIRAHRAYVNVHSTPLTPGGEIRGQVGERGRGHDEHHDH
jgi:hypothetical protein